MAITRTQIARQLLQFGGGADMGGGRGPSGPPGGGATSMGSGRDFSPSRDTGGGGDRIIDLAKRLERRQEEITKSQDLNFGQFFGSRVPTFQKPTIGQKIGNLGSKIFGGILGAINPALGFAFNTISSAPGTFKTFKDSPTLEAFRDNIRGYGKTKPVFFDNPNLDEFITDDEEDTTPSTITTPITMDDSLSNAVALLNKPGLIQLRNYEKKKGMAPLDPNIDFTDQDQEVLDELLRRQADPDTTYGPVLKAAEGGIMNPDVVGGIMDLESARQMYGLGKLVKKVTRSVKKIAKSPIGKAALIAAPFAFGPGRAAIGNFFGRGSFNPLKAIVGSIDTASGLEAVRSPFGELISKIPGGGIGAGILGASALAGALTPEEENEAQQISDNTGINIEEIRANPNKYLARRFRAEGGSTEGKEPVAKKTMPLLDMGGQEMDLRAEGGFVPIGRMEKADDVPARLSKNEFVFTADAVRNAGEGDVDKGAEVMYNMMKNLEAGGEVSEESQGLQGARKMFQTSQRLEEVL